MGITVLSTVSANSALPALSGGMASDAPTIDFAALLGEQISSTLAGLMSAESGKDGQLLQESQHSAKETKEEFITESSIAPEQLAELAALNPLLTNQTPSLPPQSGQELLTEKLDLDDEYGSNRNKVASDLLPFSDEENGKNNLLNTMSAALAGQQLTVNQSKETQQPFALPLNKSSVSESRTSLSTLSAASINIEGKLTNLGEAANIAGAELPGAQSPLPTFTSALNSANAAIHAQSNQTRGETHIPTPIHETRWAQDFGEKIVWLARSEQQTAQISINPPQLGPMQISLSLNGDQASAIFASPHAEVRQAIEDAMPRLREMLSSAGISLGDANVGTQLPQQNRDNPSQFSNSNPNGARFQDENAILRGDSKESSNSGTLPIQRGRGLVDLFA